jgi:hypothetical protein
VGTKLKAIFFAHDIKRKIVLVQMVEMLRIFSHNHFANRVFWSDLLIKFILTVNLILSIK